MRWPWFVLVVLLPLLAGGALLLLPPLPTLRLTPDMAWAPPPRAPEDPRRYLRETIRHLAEPGGLDTLVARVHDGIVDDPPPAPSGLRLPPGWEDLVVTMDGPWDPWESAVAILGELRLPATLPLLTAACAEAARREPRAAWQSYTKEASIAGCCARVAPLAGMVEVAAARHDALAAAPARRRAALIILALQRQEDAGSFLLDRLGRESGPDLRAAAAWAAAMQGAVSAHPPAVAALQRDALLDVEALALIDAAAGWSRADAIAAACAGFQADSDGWPDRLGVACAVLLRRLHAVEAAAELRTLALPHYRRGEREVAILRLCREWGDAAAIADLAARCRRGDTLALASFLDDPRPDAEAAAWMRPAFVHASPWVRYQALHALLVVAPQERAALLAKARRWSEPGLRDEVAAIAGAEP